MSGNRKVHYGKHRSDKTKLGDKGREVLEQIDENNAVIKMFQDYSTQLDNKHDRHERIFKVGRDITIESKRIIFLLHSAATELDTKRGQILSEANIRLQQLVDKNFKIIATELEGQDPYLFLRAYTGGLQEFIEAVLYHQYLRSGCIESCDDLKKRFFFRVSTESDDSIEISLDAPGKNVVMPIPLQDFFLGMADFTGELMKRCINNLSSGNLNDCFKICDYVRDIYTNFLRVHCSLYKELGRKIYVLKQSVLKMEYVCYTIKVRGSEVPKHMLAAVINNDTNSDVEDEGFY